MSVTLRKRKNGDGTTTLLLDIYHNGKRKYEFLKELRLSKISNAADRQKNKDNFELAIKIAAKRSHELAASDYDMVTDIGKNTLVVEWMQGFIDKYRKKDKRNMQGALNRFSAFLKQEKIQSLTFGRINEVTIGDYQDFLREHSKGEGAGSYFGRFKKMMKQAYRNKLMLHNPATDVPTIQGKARKKDVLTLEEIQTLANTSTESSDVKRACLFALVTGLRWIDVKALNWENVNLKEGFVSLSQSKTENDVQINLNRTAIEILGKQSKGLVFNLPTANGANKTLKAWVKRAKIQKKITFHNLRHSFGTNLIYTGTDVTVASSLLGHTSLKHTQRYVRAARELKERATDKLNFNL